MNSPAISVVMSVYNGQTYLAEAVQSILNQTFRDFEFIIIDDGSADKTPEVLAAYATRDPRIRVITHENKGRATSLNIGIAAAHSNYIVRMDADDIALPDRFQLQFDFLERHPAVGVLGGAVQLIRKSGQVLRTVYPPVGDSEIRTTMLDGNPMWHPTVMMRKGIVDAVGGYRKQLLDTDDYDLFLRMTERCQIANLHELVLHYRIHANQVSVRNMKHQTMCVVAARAAAALRRDGKPDPLSAIDHVDYELLNSLNTNPKEITQKLLGTCGYWIQLFTDVDDEAALHVLDELLKLSNTEPIDRSVLCEAWLTAAAIHYRQKRPARALSSLARALLLRPIVAGRPIKRALRRRAPAA